MTPGVVGQGGEQLALEQPGLRGAAALAHERGQTSNSAATPTIGRPISITHGTPFTTHCATPRGFVAVRWRLPTTPPTGHSVQTYAYTPGMHVTTSIVCKTMFASTYSKSGRFGMTAPTGLASTTSAPVAPIVAQKPA